MNKWSYLLLEILRKCHWKIYEMRTTLMLLSALQRDYSSLATVYRQVYSENVHIYRNDERTDRERGQMYISLEEETRSTDNATFFPCFSNGIFRPHRWWEFRCKDAACVISSKMRRRGVMSAVNNGGRHRLCALETWTRTERCSFEIYLQLTPLR